MFIIYRHTCLVTGKSYVGWTSLSIRKRWENHIKIARKGATFHFHCALRKHGLMCWKHDVLFVCKTKREALKAEVYWIAKLDTYNNGYNMTRGGEGNLWETPWNKGKDIRNERPDVCKKLSDSHMGQKPWNVGKPATEEAIESLKRSWQRDREWRSQVSRNAIRKLIAQQNKPIVQLSLNGDVIAEYPSVKAAGEATGAKHISGACHGTRKTAGGFRWRFA